jgi:hypothetical protein
MVAGSPLGNIERLEKDPWEAAPPASHPAAGPFPRCRACPTQTRIASILSAYDDLIENNTRRIALLEQAAQLLYEEWFVRLRAAPIYEQTTNLARQNRKARAASDMLLPRLMSGSIQA